MTTHYEHNQLRGRAFWVLAAVSAAGMVWVVGQAREHGYGLLEFETLIMFGLALMPLAFWGLPMLHHGRQALRVDDDGIWREGELIVAADRIRAIGVHVRKRPDLDTRTHPLEGRFLAEYRIHELGPVLVPKPDKGPEAWLWGNLRPVVVVVEPDEDEEWMCRDGHHVARVLLTRDERRLVEALLTIAPHVDEPQQLLVPEVQLGMTHRSKKILPTDQPPVEGWTWADGTRVL